MFALKKIKSNRGLTMIEMLMIGVIVGVVAAMAVPKLDRATEKMKFNTANRSITSALRLARSMAVTTKTNYGVYFDYDAHDHDPLQGCCQSDQFYL